MKRTRRILIFALSLVLGLGMLSGLAFPASAETDTTTGLIYEISDGEATVTGYTDTINSEFVIPATLGGCPVTSIGFGAFSGCKGLTSITIPGSVTSIGDYAFYGCSSLVSITVPDSVTSIGGYAFFSTAYYDNDENWTGDVLYIGKHLIEAKSTISGDYSIRVDTVTIADEAFYECGNLSTIAIPDSVTSIGYNAFFKCSSLASITIGSSVKNIGRNAFEWCGSLTAITIPDGVTSIGWGAFADTSLETIIVDEGNPVYHAAGNCLIETATKTLVAGCKTSVIPTDGSVTSIGYFAFEGCDVTSITIPDGVTSIGDAAFYCCYKLASITIPNSVTSIDWNAFSGCSSLASITIPDSVTSIGEYALSECSSLASITIPDSVTSIGYGAFSGCKGLTSITIPGSVTSIGYYVFSDCSSLVSITIPDGVTSIGAGAFQKCESLTAITIPDSVTYIGNDAFYESPVTLYVTENSYAHTYAIENGVRYELLGHTHTWNGGKVTTKPTESKAGVKTYTCTVCKKTKTESIAKLTPKVNVVTVFKDLKKSDWYVKSGAIDFVYNQNLFNGTSETEFSPNDQMTRGMFVTVLGRLHGVKANNNAKTKFVDVKKDYYTGYVKWASDNGIVSGTDATHFSPNENVSREQICAMMVRYCSFAKIKLKKKNAAISFKDAGKISGYAKKAVKACQQGAVVNGEKKSDGYYFRPQGNATRAEVATIMMNFYNNYVQ